MSPSRSLPPTTPSPKWGQEHDDSSSESCSGNGSSTLNPSTSSSTQGDSAFPEMNGNGTAAPMDFTTSADDQPINLCDKLTPAHVTPSYQSDGCSADGLRSRVKYAVKTTAEVRPRLQVATDGAGGWPRSLSLVGREGRTSAMLACHRCG
ncbi:nucleolar protein 4-like [Limosa lapponica baueri]|uniref:Nucleolar protein 4-like n=1 Tax=Limosa lapponica baueri TaxID=1758121 RepID=A0A2I0SZ56_LIMLA|nr:nucleolar protein 4-like [Limosa lapponica baueri]